jgi:hypothetical protein
MKANARGWDHTARYTELSQERSHLSGLAPNASTPLPAALVRLTTGGDTPQRLQAALDSADARDG